MSADHPSCSHQRRRPLACPPFPPVTASRTGAGASSFSTSGSAARCRAQSYSHEPRNTTLSHAPVVKAWQLALNTDQTSCTNTVSCSTGTRQAAELLRTRRGDPQGGPHLGRRPHPCARASRPARPPRRARRPPARGARRPHSRSVKQTCAGCGLEPAHRAVTGRLSMLCGCAVAGRRSTLCACAVTGRRMLSRAATARFAVVLSRAAARELGGERRRCAALSTRALAALGARRQRSHGLMSSIPEPQRSQTTQRA